MEITGSHNIPKVSLPTLELMNNCYVVEGEGMYHYFPVRVEEISSTSPFLSLKKAPPLLVDGYVIYKKQVFEVTSDDILRARIRKSKEIQKETVNGTITLVSGVDAASASIGQIVVSDSNEPSTLGTAILEVGEDVDTAWKEQAESLLYLVSSQEGGEWEIESIAQS